MTFKTDGNYKDIMEKRYFHILARGVIIDGDYILVAKDKNADNTFLPGGHLEFNENLKQALKREIKEEFGNDCSVDEYIGCIETQWNDNEIDPINGKDIVNQSVDHIFMINGINKQMEIKSKENHLNFYWIKINDIEKENLLPKPMRKIVESIYNGNVINYLSGFE
jgi:ADP-ribose pyrophosphatase YjhB (NUDIX family)